MPGLSIPGAVVHLSPRGRLERPELVVAPGPAEIADTGDGSLDAVYGYAWALLWDDNTPTLRLFREDGGDWIERTPASPLPELTSPARHIALAFDRSARPMIAWQALDGIRIRQWDASTSQYIVRGPFAGQDPGLVFDGLPRQEIGGGDVVLYYLSDDRTNVHARLERDVYGTEYDVATLGREDLYLDQVVRLPYRVRLELANDQPDAAGALDRVRFTSDLWPVPVTSTAHLALTAARGVFDQTVVMDDATDGADVTLSSARGEYIATFYFGSSTEAAGVTPGARGVFDQTIVLETDTDPVASTLGARGVFDQTIVLETDTDAVASTLDARGEYQQI